jgi:hypothetical protein
MPLVPEDISDQDSAEAARLAVAPISLPVPFVPVVSLEATDLPLLVINQANLPATAKALAKHLASTNNLFERGSLVVKIVRTPGGVRSQPLNVHSTVIETHAVCRPVEEWTVRGEVVREAVTLPNRVAQLFLNLDDQRGLQRLQGICAAPLLSDDGSVRCDAGYDRLTGLWCVGVELPPIPERPTVENAQQSLRLIRSMFATFPFADAVRVTSNAGSLVVLEKGPAVDESTLILGLMTTVCRPSLPLAPALLIRAPHLSGSGTGKGLLVHAIAQIAFGQEPTAFTSGGGRQELGKRIESVLIESGPIAFLDNCNDEQLSSSVLAQVITESSVTTRLLGHSRMVRLNTNAFMALTGNNVRISEDSARRFLVVDLDAKCENPEQRYFHEDFGTLVKARREQLLAAALTIWRWGRQNILTPGMPLGSFQQWASWCRDPLLALGCADPVQRVADIKSEDPRRLRIFEFFKAWHARYGSEPIKLKDLDPGVREFIGGSRQKLATFVGSLEGTRAGGFVMIITRPESKWDAADYAVHHEGETTAT